MVVPGEGEHLVVSPRFALPSFSTEEDDDDDENDNDEEEEEDTEEEEEVDFPKQGASQHRRQTV